MQLVVGHSSSAYSYLKNNVYVGKTVICNKVVQNALIFHYNKLRNHIPKNLSTVSVVLARSGPLGVIEDLDRALLDTAVIL